MPFGTALPLLDLAAEITYGIDRAIGLRNFVADGQQQRKPGLQVLWRGCYARIFVNLEVSCVHLVTDLELHLVGPRRGRRTFQDILVALFSLDFGGIGVARVPDEAVGSGFFWYTWLLVFIFLLLVT